jgi:hypothetical protein
MKALGYLLSDMFVGCWRLLHRVRRHKITEQWVKYETVPVYVCSCGKSILTTVPEAPR